MEMREKIKLIRLAKGWSQKKLAEKAGINANTILNFESGKTSSSIDVVMDILNAMGYTLEIVKIKKEDR